MAHPLPLEEEEEKSDELDSSTIVRETLKCIRVGDLHRISVNARKKESKQASSTARNLQLELNSRTNSRLLSLSVSLSLCLCA